MKLNIDKMGSISAASYLTAPNDAVLYRTIMRILYNEKESYNAQLSSDDILLHLKKYDEFASLSADKLKSTLSQLTIWGCVLPMQDPGRVKTIEEYQNKIYRYSLTEDAVIIERMTIELENMFSEGNTLSSSLLVRINDDLLQMETAVNEMSNKELDEWWRNLFEDFKRLSKNYSDYTYAFGSVKGEKLISSVDFLIHKDKFIEYLRDFITQLQKHSVRIENNLRKISPDVKNRLMQRLLESEAEIPRTNSEMISLSEIENKIHNDWNALYSWFVSADGRESTCNRAMEYTNDIIRKMVNNAVLLMQLQNSGISKKQEYKKYMEMFSSCSSTDEAHCLSAHVFGVMNVGHYKFNADRETDSIFENAAELSPQVFEIRPVTRKYKPRIRAEGITLRNMEKEMQRQQKLAGIVREQKLIGQYTKDNKLCLSELTEETIPVEMRITILKWITAACQNRSKNGIADFGKKFHMQPSDRYITLHFDDGDLFMPAYTFEDDDLHPMADAMSKIEDAHSKIEISVKALNEAKLIANEYDRYNRYMLWKKANIYLAKNKELRAAESEYEVKQKQIGDAEENIEQFSELSNHAEETLNHLAAEKESLDITDINEYISKKAKSEKSLSELKTGKDNKQKSIDDKQETIRKQYNRKRQEEDKKESAEAQALQCIRDMTEYEEDHFPFYHRFLTTLKNEDLLSHQQYASEADRFKQKISLAHDSIKKYESKKEEAVREEEKLTNFSELYQSAVSSFEEAQRQLNEQKDELIEKLYIAAKENTEYLINDLTLKKIETTISEYEGSGSARDYLALILANHADMKSGLDELLVQAQFNKTQAENSCKQLEQELEELKNADEPVPVRSEQRIAARNVLAEHHIAYRSFYECIDFKENISDEDRAVIEAELTDMGILDALIIPKEQKEMALSLLSDFSDAYIVCDETISDSPSNYFDIVAEDNFSEEAAKIIFAFESKIKLSADGFYQNGILAGHSMGQTAAGFIGIENRRKYRERQIKELTEKLTEAQNIYDEAVQKYQEIKHRMSVLDQEYQSLTDISDLNAALNLVFTEQQHHDNAKRNLEEQEMICSKIKAELAGLFTEIERSCAEFPQYEKTSRFFAELKQDIENFMGLIYTAMNHISNKISSEHLLEQIAETIEDAEYDKNELDSELKQIRKSISFEENNIRICEEFLNAPENIDRAQKLEKINKKIEKLKVDKKQYDDSILQLRTRIEFYQKEINTLSDKRIRLSEEENTVASYFQEERELGFVFPDNDKTLKQYAEASLKITAEEDKQKNITDIYQKLMDTYRKNSNILSSEYRPMFETMFKNSGADVTRSRVILTLMWQGRTVTPFCFREELEKSIEHDQSLLKREEENMFKEILLNTISKKLSNRIRESSEWIRAMSEQMAGINTSMGLTFKLVWTPKKDLGENELPFEELNKLLAKDKQWITSEDIDKLTGHFRSKIEYERRVLEEKGEDVNYSDIIRNVLDFRNWFEFTLKYKEPKKQKFENMTSTRFNTFSGGERALSLYIPLFAAVAAQYEKAGEQAPRIIALDEAFAGVDESNISEMFALLERLDFGYIVNSQGLWGCYDTVPSLGIAELFHDKNSDFITVIKYKWNGKQKILAE